MRISLSKQEARRFILSYQYLGPSAKLKGKQGVLEYVSHVGCIQFDPLNIVGHNQQLVLQSRVKGFKRPMLRELLYEDRELVDGWNKNMSIFPVEDWPYFERLRRMCFNYYSKRSKEVSEAVPYVRKIIEEKGPVSSKDLDLDKTVKWSWAPTRLSRAALESMYFWGELIVHHKVHTRKYYDFAHRHIPDDIMTRDDPNRSDEEYHDWHTLRRIGGVGLLWSKAGDAWLGIQGAKSRHRQLSVERLLLSGALEEVEVEGLSMPVYMCREDSTHLAGTEEFNLRPKSYILAPLDNVMWDRRLLQEIFDFNYVWEVYKPARERKYGYYVLPVLYGDRFVARFEPGMDKKSGVFTIKNWWWEEGIEIDEEMAQSLDHCFTRFVEFLGAEQVRLAPFTAKVRNLDWLEQLSG